MVLPTRKIVLTGLGFMSLGLLTGRILGQGQQDDGVRRAANTAAAAPAPKPTAPPVIGTIDMDRVLKDYEKFKFLGEEFQAQVLARKNELMKLSTDGQALMEQMNKFTPGSPDYKKFEDKITFLKAQMEAKKEQAEREFEMKQAESMATLYKEVQDMASRVAQWRKMNYVVKVSNTPITGGDPKSVMAAMSSTVLYSDPQNDITNDVVSFLNRQYRMKGGQPPKGNTPATARAPQQPADAAATQAPAGAPKR
jgi:outer membrane protein